VYRARERALDRDVAIKVLPMARTFDTEFVERFQREARLSASLEHPHIIPIYRVGQAGRVNYFVMKYLQGPSLADALDSESRLDADEVERMLLEVGDALEHAHVQGVIHRDVKPDNIMKDHTGRFVVMDFGIAKSLGSDQLTQLGGSIGTPGYMSPEQARGGELDGGSDFYSLGVVAFHCLAGRAPFTGDDPLSVLYSHLHDPVPDPGLSSAEDRRVFSVVRALMAKDTDDRPRSVEDLKTELSRAPSSAASPAAAPTTVVNESMIRAAAFLQAVRPWLEMRTRRFWIGGGIAFIAAVAVLGRDGAAAACRLALPDAARDDRALILEPIGTIRGADDIELSFIACGMPDDQAFEARVTIRPTDDGGVVGRVGRFFGGGDDPIPVTWDDRADGFATSRTRTVPLVGLEPGSYRVTLRVGDKDGGEVEARHDFTVVER